MQRTANENVAGSRRICKRWSYGWSSSESIITKSTSSCPITKSSIMGFSFSFLFFFVLNFTRRYQWYFSFFVTFWTKQIIQRRVIIPQVHSFNKLKPCSAISCLDGLLNTQISCCNSLFTFFFFSFRDGANPSRSLEGLHSQPSDPSVKMRLCKQGKSVFETLTAIGREHFACQDWHWCLLDSYTNHP